MPTKDHIHTIVRAQTDRFMCADPECSWRDSKIYLVGKKSVCPYCTTVFNLGKTDLRLAKPWCGTCDKRPLSVQDAYKHKAEELMIRALEDTNDKTKV